MTIQEKTNLTVDACLDMIASVEIDLQGEIQFKYSQSDYEQIVRDIVEKEIGNGEGSSFVIAQKISGKIADFDVMKALSVFKKLLQSDYGSYWTFVFFDGGKFHIGATPERHISREK